MTIAINPAQRRNPALNRAASVVPPAEVWDVDPQPLRHEESASLRAIHPLDRKAECPSGAQSSSTETVREAFEPGHELRDTVVLGVCMTAALLIGSAFGGVFSDGEVDPALLTSSHAGQTASMTSGR